MTARPTPEQVAALARVRRAAVRLKDARATAVERIRQAVAEESLQLRLSLREAVQLAWATVDAEGNRPAKRLLKDALMSKDHATLELYLSGFEDTTQQQFIIDSEASTFTITWYKFPDGERVEETVTRPIGENGQVVWDFHSSKDAYSIKVLTLAAEGRYMDVGEFSLAIQEAING